MISEWMQVMLDEIASKRSQAAEELREVERRRREAGQLPTRAAPTDDAVQSVDPPA